jgi:hypothetical protein
MPMTIHEAQSGLSSPSREFLKGGQVHSKAFNEINAAACEGYVNRSSLSAFWQKRERGLNSLQTVSLASRFNMLDTYPHGINFEDILTVFCIESWPWERARNNAGGSE